MSFDAVCLKLPQTNILELIKNKTNISHNKPHLNTLQSPVCLAPLAIAIEKEK